MFRILELLTSIFNLLFNMLRLENEAQLCIYHKCQSQLYIHVGYVLLGQSKLLKYSGCNFLLYYTYINIVCYANLGEPLNWCLN